MGSRALRTPFQDRFKHILVSLLFAIYGYENPGSKYPVHKARDLDLRL